MMWFCVVVLVFWEEESIVLVVCEICDVVFGVEVVVVDDGFEDVIVECVCEVGVCVVVFLFNCGIGVVV